MINIAVPSHRSFELDYVLEVILGEFLGLAFNVMRHDELFIEISKSDSKCKLSLDTSFFQQANKSWLQAQSMPILPLQSWCPADDDINVNLVEESIPVLYGKPGLIKNANTWHLNVDIFGSIFFMLSRYEELITQDRDEHNRFPSSASLAYKAGFLHRPIVNEYLEILWECMHQLLPQLQRKNRKFRKLIGCDVDHPFDHAAHSISSTIKRVGARLIRNKQPSLAMSDGLNYIAKKFNSDRFDSYRNNIDWIMQVNKSCGNKVAFYFIPLQTDPKKEDANDIFDPKIKQLLKHIHTNGHEIGFHPGYATYKHKENFKKSSGKLKETLSSLGIPINNLGGRQHYLMYDVSKTPQLWNENGFIYDSSLSFADSAGFRCGVCYEYTMYDLKNRRPLKIKQRPLIVMECSIIQYENLGRSQKALERFKYFMNICKQFDGDFTLIWHNSSFVHKLDREIYMELIK